MNKKRLKQDKILGINIISKKRSEVLDQVQKKLENKQKFYIVTPNPEIILYAQNDDEFKSILNNADISIPDGIGLIAAKKFIDLPNPNDPMKRLLTLIAQGLGVGFSVLFDKKWLTKEIKLIKGRELFLDIIKIVYQKKYKIFFLGGEGEEAKKAAERLRKTYSGIEIETFAGPILDENANPKTRKDKKIEKEAIKKINEYKPDMIFVAMLFPRQEKWISKWLDKINTYGAMAVGGTFNYISGEQMLPPKWMAQNGLEWMWRLINDPKRTRRILKAVVEFPIEVFSYKLTKRY
jgi:N-acetylglucosaminyldiphosphoundecaprenol N-acetyl-beta-D-mannosaminyltransferase